MIISKGSLFKAILEVSPIFWAALNKNLMGYGKATKADAISKISNCIILKV